MTNFCQSRNRRNHFPENFWQSKVAHQIVCLCGQCSRNFNQGIHRRRFFAPLNTTDENSRKPRRFSQLFLAESRFSASRPDGFAKETAVFESRHVLLADRKPAKPTMSLTTSFACMKQLAVIKNEKVSGRGRRIQISSDSSGCQRKSIGGFATKVLSIFEPGKDILKEREQFTVM